MSGFAKASSEVDSEFMMVGARRVCLSRVDALMSESRARFIVVERFDGRPHDW